MGDPTTEIQYVGIAIPQIDLTRSGKRHGLHDIGDCTVKVDIKAAAIGHLGGVDTVGKHNVTRRRLEVDRADTVRR